MPGVTKQQIAKAKEWDLLSYLMVHEPEELKKSGPEEYRTKTHDSLVISNGKWHWFSRNIGGRSALDYLIKVRGEDFITAVNHLCQGIPSPSLFQPVEKKEKREEVKKPFLLPEAASSVNR
ncbi:topoisomerase, partial [Bacillus licheniformis]